MYILHVHVHEQESEPYILASPSSEQKERHSTPGSVHHRSLGDAFRRWSWDALLGNGHSERSVTAEARRTDALRPLRFASLGLGLTCLTFRLRFTRCFCTTAISNRRCFKHTVYRTPCSDTCTPIPQLDLEVVTKATSTALACVLCSSQSLLLTQLSRTILSHLNSSIRRSSRIYDLEQLVGDVCAHATGRMLQTIFQGRHCLPLGVLCAAYRPPLSDIGCQGWGENRTKERKRLPAAISPSGRQT